MQIICGRQGTGKTTEMFNRIKKLSGEADIYIIVPEQYTFATEEAVFKELNVEAVSDINVMSLNRLAQTLTSESSEAAARVLSEEGKALIVKYVIGQCSEKLKIFADVASKKGFADDVSDLLSEIKRNSLSYDDFSGLTYESNRRLKEKLDDFKPIYEAYSEILGDSYIDKDDFLSYASRFSENSELVKNSYFFFDDFYTFDRSAYGFITELAKYAKDCTFTLTYDEDEFYLLTKETLQELEGCAKDAGQPLTKTVMQGKKNSREDISYLEENITSYCSEPYTGAERNIKTFEGDDIYEEASYVAARIKELVREQSYRYSDITVSVSEPEKYSYVIKEVFDSAEIPYFIDTRRKIIFSSPVKALLFLTGLSDEFSTSDLIAFAKTGFGDATDDEIKLMQNYALEFGIKGKMWLKDFTRNNSWQTYALEEVNAAREKMISPVLGFIKAVENETTVGGYVKAIYSYMVESGFPDKIRMLCDDFKAQADYETANTYAQIYNKLVSLCEQLREFLGEEKLNRRAVHEMLTYALGVCEVGIIPSNLDSVTVGDVVRSRAEGVKAMFIMGANEGMLPQGVSPGGILSDTDKEALKKENVRFIDTAEYRREKENFILYTLLSKPSELLYVTRFANDTDGEDAKRSAAMIFSSICEMFDGCMQQSDAGDKLAGAESAFSAMTLNKALRADGASKADPYENRLFDAVYDYFKKSGDRSYYADIADSAFSFTNEAVIKNKALYDEALKSQKNMSISKLEKYAACPFSFFAQYMLKAKTRYENKPDKLDTGSILHEIMQKYSELIINGKIDPKAADEKFIADMANELTESVTDSHNAGKYKMLSYSDYIKTKLSRAAVAAATELTEQMKNSDFLIKKAEVEFNFEGSYAPICIETRENRKVYIQGKIDRIDTCEIGGEKYARIIDYKTKGKEVSISKLYFGLDLQLPLYIRAYTENEKDTIPGGLLYFKLSPNVTSIKKPEDLKAIKKEIRKKFKMSGIALSDLKVIKAMDNTADTESCIEDVSIKNGELKQSKALTDREGFEILCERTEKNIADIYDSIGNANIAIAPSRVYGDKKDGCTYCNYGGVCKFSEVFHNKYRMIPKINEKEIKAAYTSQKTEVK